LQFLSQLETKTEKAVALRRLGFRPCEVARYLYPDYLEAPRRATHRVLNLLRAYRLRQFDTDGFDTDVKPARNQPASPSPTCTPLFKKINARSDERYLIELKQLARALYDRYVRLYDADRLAWSTIERCLEACSEMLQGEKIHFKPGYVKLPTRAASGLVAALIWTAYTCLHNAALCRGLRSMIEEVKKLQPEYKFYLGEALQVVSRLS